MGGHRVERDGTGNSATKTPMPKPSLDGGIQHQGAEPGRNIGAKSNTGTGNTSPGAKGHQGFEGAIPRDRAVIDIASTSEEKPLHTNWWG